MPDKEGSEDKTTKSVVAKKQKQMMGEEGYDVARDQGRVRPSKDKKDATTMPVSKEIKKTRKVNKGPSALELVKKKYKGQIMDELDLSKVAESFGGYIVEAPLKSLTGDPEEIEKRIKKTAKSKDQLAAKSGSKVKGTPKGPTLKPTTSGRKIVKKMSKSESDEIGKKLDAKIDPKQSARSDARQAERKFRKDFKKSGATGDFSPTMDPKLRKVRQAKRDARTKKLGTPDPFTTPTPKKPIKPFGDKPVAGGMKFPPTVATSTKRDGIRKIYREPVGPGGSTIPKPPKRTPIPKDTGSLADAPKVKKRFSKMSQDIKDLKVDRDIDKRVANPKIASKIEYGTVNYSKNKKFDQEISRRRSAETTRGDAINRSMGTSGSTEGAGGANTGIKPKKGKKISKGADFSGVSRQTGAKKVSKQLGRNPKLGGSVVKVVGKETKKAAAKTAAKQITKTAGQKALKKGLVKGVAKQIPGVGAALAGAEAGYRALKGDFKGAALSAGEAIPGLGLGFTAANVARDVSRAKKAASAVKTVTKAKRVKDAVKVVTPTVVGTQADKIAQAKKKIGTLAKSPEGKAAVIGGSALATSKVNRDLKNFKVPAEKGGRTGFRSAK
tara:strand:- start:44 stop:1873 length:1830 start_codon:yes stop_codon:yes gene_type:complete